MKNKLCLIIILFFTVNIFSQNRKVDSLKNILSKTSSDTQKVQILSQISRLYWNKNNTLSLQYSKRALEISTDINYKKGIAMALADIGVASMYDNNKKNALDNLLKAITIYDEIKDTASLRATYINTGTILYTLNRIDEAKNYLEKGLNLYLQERHLKWTDSTAIIIIYNNLSLIELDKNNIQKAIDLQFKALKLRKELKSDKGIAISYANLGLMYEKIDSFNLAEKYYNLAIDINGKVGNTYGVAFSKIDLANFYFHKNEIDTAIIQINNAIKLCEKNGFLTELPRAYLSLVEMKKSQENYKEALEAYEKYQTYKDSVANQSFYDDINKMKEEYKKETELRKEQKREFELKKQKIIRNSLIVIAVIVILLIIVLYNRYKIKIKSERELQKLNKEKDKFFSILAHDLRSPIVGMVTLSDAIINNFEVLTKKELLSYNKNLNKTAKSISYLLENLLDWAMSQINQRKYNFENLKLYKIAKEGIESLLINADKKQIKVNFDIDENIEVYADANTLKTVFRNLTNNAIKFTPKGGKIDISAKQNGDKVEIKIQDTGVGMSKNALNHLFDIGKQQTSLGTENEKGTGFGLLIVKEFISKNKGEIKVESTEGKGTTFIITLKTHKNNGKN